MSIDFSRMRSVMEHNKGLRLMGGGIRRIGLVHVLHTLQANKKRKEFAGRKNEFTQFFKEHKAEFQKVYSMLEDDFSKETYSAVIRFRKTYDIRYLNKVNVKPQYFLKDILPPADDEVFIDGGAYIGDSTKDFLKLYQEKKRYRIYCWEPDERNIREMRKILGDKIGYDIKPYALWSDKEKLNFSNEGTSVSSIGDGDIIVNADSIDNQHKGETDHIY